MSFACPPQELVSSILEALAFSGYQGITLPQLWKIVSNKLGSETDDFQKQIIWSWLFFSDSSSNSQLVIKSGERNILPISNYNQFLKNEGKQEDLRIFPSADIQWTFLTGFEVSKKMRLQLGDYPFQLLCEISKHGANGIYSPDLCKATGQDPRSLPLRLRKLEELGLIKKKNVYNEKLSQHTSICVHFKSAGDDFKNKNSEILSDFESSRDGRKLKLSIIEAVKEAPNNLRGFKDLKSELGLDKSKSTNKFFRGVVEYLHNHGYVERLMVKDSNNSHLVYCIKYLKDIERDSESLSDDIDLLAYQGDSYLDEDYVGETELPKLNKFFPLSSQFHELIETCGSRGITSMEIIRSLSGVSDYRPFLKILDSITNFIMDESTLKASKPYMECYVERSILRAYDFESKFKFYRYFTKNHTTMNIQDKTPRIRNENLKSDESLSSINAKLFTPLTKSPKGALSITKKRKIKLPLDRKTKKPKTETIPILNQDSIQFNQTHESPTKVESPGDALYREPVDPSKLPIPKQKKAQGSKPDSLKANRRRIALLEIIKSFGGVTYTTTNLCRLLDEKLGNSTVTDKKTLARDVSILVNNNDLEVRNISFMMSGQQVSRKLLILTSSDLKPSEDEIEKASKQCIEDNGNKLNFQLNRRVIESEVTLYKIDYSKSKKGKTRKGRLESLAEQESTKVSSKTVNKRRSKNHMDNTDQKLDNNMLQAEDKDDPLSAFISKRHKKRKKATTKKSSETASLVSNPRRYRTTVKFDESDMTTLFRSVIISKAFKKGTIDFEKIASLFSNVTPKEVKQKWTLIRKQIGGLPSVTKVTESFEQIIMKGIDSGSITTSDLESIDFNFFLDFWKENDTVIISIIDKTPLYLSPDDNYDFYHKVEQKDNYQDLYEQVEDNSMRQKESILSGVPFYYEKVEYLPDHPNEDLRGLLKAIFATPQDKFDSQKVKTLLAKYDEDTIQGVTSQLINEKEISYYSLDDSDTSFVLTDKIHNSFVSRIFSEKFFNQASEFKRNLSAISEASKGLILSQGISGGEISTVLSKLSDESLSMVRIDKPYVFNGYESRLIDKDKLSCNILVWEKSDKYGLGLVSFPVPTGASCSHIWLDLNGNINEQMWIKILISILYYVYFRPGMPGAMLHQKLSSVLSKRDFFATMEWLIKTNCISQGKYDGYWVKKNWFCILG